jgi:hypothetical protein
MLIHIESAVAGQPPEWLLLELQGKLGLPGGEDFSGRLLCHLRQEGKGLVLRVGNHTVVGSLKDLPKPLHVMQRQDSQDGSVRLQVRCIVRRKLVFTERPQPVISAALGEASLGGKQQQQQQQRK